MIPEIDFNIKKQKMFQLYILIIKTKQFFNCKKTKQNKLQQQILMLKKNNKNSSDTFNNKNKKCSNTVSLK